MKFTNMSQKKMAMMLIAMLGFIGSLYAWLVKDMEAIAVFGFLGSVVTAIAGLASDDKDAPEEPDPPTTNESGKAKPMLIATMLVAVLMSGCAAWQMGAFERLAIFGISQELGVEFIQNNRDSKDTVIGYLNHMEGFEGEKEEYLRLFNDGMAYVIDKLAKEVVDDPGRRRRIVALLDQMRTELQFETYIVEGITKIKLPEKIDLLAIKAGVRGFKSGIEGGIEAH